ncbi:hypothetical protein [Thalassovita aquimarina]|uniref:Uncharacterized protein n=1 Tax=Thalassovita aquimarina TaxID=2785917 RepID=A0ABS5HXH6_9RHOB|nr:hypothetical protein [Thalassovita aquimarina]MBR9653531.1 hypothetical protein [Thalassovita aquimarina]
MSHSESIWINYKLKFEGRDAERHMLEAHPAGHSIEGFSWALGLTLNYGITGRLRYSRDLSKSAKIFISPPKQGSLFYDLNILVQENPFLTVVVGSYAMNTVTPYINGLIGYVFKQAMGIGEDFPEGAKKYLKKLKGDELTAISQRIEPPLTRAHTAIGRTADEIILDRSGAEIVKLDQYTKENLKAQPVGTYDTLDSNVTSFNILTGNGRLYSPETETTIPFALRDNYRHGTTTSLIASMDQYSLGRMGTIRIVGERVETSGGRLVKYIVGSAEEIPKADWVDGVDPMRQRRQ